MKKITYYLDGTTQRIYSGIERVYGGWIATTEGNPITLNDLEDAQSYAETDLEYAEIEEEISLINSLIEENEGEELTEEDIEYINEWLEIWGC